MQNNIIESIMPYQLSGDTYDELRKHVRSLAAAANRLKADFEQLDNTPLGFAETCKLEKLCNSVICDSYVFNEHISTIKYILTKRLCGTFWQAR